MHKEKDIKIENISKIEGHGSLDIKIADGKVKYVKLKIIENKRFFTQAIRGKLALSLPQMTARICGTCSIAHSTCCLEAVESAIKLKPSEQTMLLRKLSMYGMMIRDHAMHLYLFCLPDLLGKDSILDFDKSQENLIKKALAVKSSGNNLSKIVAGRAIHATFTEVGRFSHIPSQEDIKKIIKELKSVRDYTMEFAQMFYDSNFRLERDTDFVSLVTKDYSFLQGEIKDSRGLKIPEEDYWGHLTRVVIPYSQASGYQFEGRGYMVGALARMNLNKNNLDSNTKKDMSKFINVFPSKNIFHNNLAQAIEILHSIDHSIKILESSDFKEEPHTPIQVKEGDGVGLIEAPRGTLYYMLSVNKEGKIRFGNIIVPTAQNQINMERDIAQLVEKNIDMEKKRLEFEIEKLIRAYDPCMSCASHFLRINWI
jgi:coenzyme F420-reducing hydrogenase alpha subunit